MDSAKGKQLWGVLFEVKTSQLIGSMLKHRPAEGSGLLDRSTSGG